MYLNKGIRAGAGARAENSRRKWLDFKEAQRQKTLHPKSVNLPKKTPSIAAYKLSLTHKQSFRPLEDMIYAVEEQPRFCIHGVKGVKIDTKDDGKMSVTVLCREIVERREHTAIQYQVDKYAGLTELKEEDHLSLGLRLGMHYIPKISEILNKHEYEEEKCYYCLELVDRLTDGLQFTPEVVFGKIENSEIRYVDSIGIFMRRNDLEPISYSINRMFLMNKKFRLENLGKRLGSLTVKKRKVLLTNV